ncbi:MAG TPA: homoserine dehydrogenase, partial [Candidatus Altiarchaeales archaeon]|nr:homoserine dehydrogenase [Candidatus Altiarchaeales archaeon]
MKNLNVMIVGFGVIGRAVAQTLINKQKDFKKSGISFNVVAVCDVSGSIVNSRGIALKPLLKKEFKKIEGLKKKNALQLLDELKLDLMVECTPGDIKTGEPGLSHIKKALSKGIHVVTSNKSPLAVAYSELMSLAKKNKALFRFEATVGGAIPILGLKDDGLNSNNVSNVYGVLNGTTNYVLTKMENEGVPLNLAVAEAQQLGYAEADPSYDIDGIDTAAKVVILANHFLGKTAKFKDVKVEGIRKITPQALELANKNGHTIKLIGDAKNMTVAPKIISID